MTLVIGTCVILSGFIVENVASYSLLQYPGIKFGSYGFQLAQIPEKSKLHNNRLVVLLGNSVYQYNFVPKHMQQIADAHGGTVSLMNMAQVSSTIYDYLVQSAKVVNSHPDLVAIAMNDGTFSVDPRFKTDCDQFVFDPTVFKNLPREFYFHVFSYQTAVDSMISTFIPLKRVDPLIRWKVKLRDRLPSWFLKWVSYPYLNIMTEGERKAKTIQMTQLKTMEENEQLFALKTLTAIFSKHRIPVLFIWQEANRGEYSSPYKMVRQFANDKKNIIFTDLAPYFDKKNFVDSLHPTAEETPRYAQRHYDAIQNALNLFERK